MCIEFVLHTTIKNICVEWNSDIEMEWNHQSQRGRRRSYSFAVCFNYGRQGRTGRAILCQISASERLSRYRLTRTSLSLADVAKDNVPLSSRPVHTPPHIRTGLRVFNWIFIQFFIVMHTTSYSMSWRRYKFCLICYDKGKATMVDRRREKGE